jgi:putative transcriptional regulator
MQINSLTGQLLLAMPTLQDPNFRDSVVLVCHHDSDGCMGLIINRPQELTVEAVLEDLKCSDAQASGPSDWREQLTFTGGPMDSFRGFVLHDGWHVYESTMQVSPELHLTASRDVLEDIACGNGPEHFMLILGYAGWGAGQLESELGNNDWLVAPANQHIVFHVPPEMRWGIGARSMGIDRSMLSDQIGHA